MMNGADVIAQAMHDNVVDTVFGLPGAHNLALWPACERADVRIVGMRHEQSCAYAADGFARVTGKVGAALVTTGPGAANTVAAVGEAWASRSPVVVMATDIPSTLRRTREYRGVLHECTDQAALFAPITKARYVLDHAAAAYEAFGDANRSPSRPVYVGVPSDLLTAPSERGVADHVAPRMHRQDLRPLIDGLQRAQRPLLWVGGGARDAGDAIDALARRIGAPVVTTYQARGLLSPDHPLLVPAPPHEPEVTALIARADLVVVVGSDLDQMNTMQWRLPLPAHRIAVNIDPRDAAKNYAMDAVVVGDASITRAIAEELSPREPWAGALPALGIAIRARVHADPQTTDAMAFLDHTETALPSDSVVFADMCVAGYWLAGHFRVERRRGLHFPMGWGTLGFALPAAIGASVATPTVAFIGDGGALFALGELSALAALGTACTVVIVDDGGYGMLRFGAHSSTANELPPVDFVAIAEAFGVSASSVAGTGPDYAKALTRAVETGEPHLLHVRARLHPPVTTTPFWPIKEDPR
jgi:thiamine pyrophosphate-dependent acetolactate synthase large subunit-like protein